MLWMEEIRVRITETDRERVLSDLSYGKTCSLVSKDLEDVRVYLHALVRTDLCIQLYWRSPLVSAEGSPEGQKLVSGLLSVGMVRHTVWKQEEPE